MFLMKTDQGRLFTIWQRRWFSVWRAGADRPPDSPTARRCD